MKMEMYTKFPNELLDWLLAKSPELTKREIVVLLAIIRNTIGWHREECRLSCRFLEKATGLDHSNANKTIKSLEDKGLIKVDRDVGISIVSLDVQGVVKTTTGGVVDLTTGVWSNQPRGCGQIDHKQINSKENIKEKKETSDEDAIKVPHEPDIFDLVS